MAHVIERGSGLAFGDRNDAVTSQPAEPLSPTPPVTTVLEGDPAALAYRPGQGAVHFFVPLNVLAAAQAVAQHYKISVAGLYRLALEQFCEADPQVGELVAETVRAGNNRIRPLSWAQTRRGRCTQRPPQEPTAAIPITAGEG